MYSLTFSGLIATECVGPQNENKLGELSTGWKKAHVLSCTESVPYKHDPTKTPCSFVWKSFGQNLGIVEASSSPSVPMRDLDGHLSIEKRPLKTTADLLTPMGGFWIFSWLKSIPSRCGILITTPRSKKRPLKNTADPRNGRVAFGSSADWSQSRPDAGSWWPPLDQRSVFWRPQRIRQPQWVAFGPSADWSQSRPDARSWWPPLDQRSVLEDHSGSANPNGWLLDLQLTEVNPVPMRDLDGHLSIREASSEDHSGSANPDGWLLDLQLTEVNPVPMRDLDGHLSIREAKPPTPMGGFWIFSWLKSIPSRCGILMATSRSEKRPLKATADLPTPTGGFWIFSWLKSIPSRCGILMATSRSEKRPLKTTADPPTPMGGFWIFSWLKSIPSRCGILMATSRSEKRPHVLWRPQRIRQPQWVAFGSSADWNQSRPDAGSWWPALDQRSVLWRPQRICQPDGWLLDLQLTEVNPVPMRDLDGHLSIRETSSEDHGGSANPNGWLLDLQLTEINPVPMRDLDGHREASSEDHRGSANPDGWLLDLQLTEINLVPMRDLDGHLSIREASSEDHRGSANPDGWRLDLQLTEVNPVPMRDLDGHLLLVLICFIPTSSSCCDHDIFQNIKSATEVFWVSGIPKTWSDPSLCFSGTSENGSPGRGV